MNQHDEIEITSATALGTYFCLESISWSAMHMVMFMGRGEMAFETSTIS